MEHKDDKGNILIYQSQDETIAQRGCSFSSLVSGVFLTILVCFAAWGLIFKVKNTSKCSKTQGNLFGIGELDLCNGLYIRSFRPRYDASPSKVFDCSFGHSEAHCLLLLPSHLCNTAARSKYRHLHGLEDAHAQECSTTQINSNRLKSINPGNLSLGLTFPMTNPG